MTATPLVFHSQPVGRTSGAEAAGAEDWIEAFVSSAECHRFYWERPARGEAFLGLGAAAVLEAQGGAALADVASAAAALWRRVESGSCAPGVGPRLVGGAAFDPGMPPDPAWAGFPAARLVLPAHAWQRRGDRAVRISQVGAADPARRAAHAVVGDRGAPELRLAAREHPDAWCDRAAAARDAVAAGALEKLVLARALDVEATQPLAIAPLLAALRDRHPDCTLFAIGCGETVFLGATPEELVECDGAGGVRASALAGSAPRGRSPKEDRRLGRMLRESKKEQEEHAIVVRALQEGLAPRCVWLEAAEAPELLRTHGIQHLHTPFVGRLADPAASGALALVSRLHPSPAVAGAPGPEALAWLRRCEGLARGWFAGPVGWAGPGGEGAFAVALRSALVRGSTATLFAGAGVVGASDPAAELDETRLKLRAVLDPLLAL